MSVTVTNRSISLQLGDWVALNDFQGNSGAYAGATTTADDNTEAWNAAITFCGLHNCGLYLPDPYYNVHLLNINSNSLGGTILDPIRIWSVCSQAAVGLQAIAGTRLICDGVDPSGATWRKAVINVVTPNGSNTGPDLTHQQYGLRLRGIYLDLVGAGLTANLTGFWLQRQWRWAMEDCGLINQGTARWSAGILLDTGERGNIKRCSFSYCATGIATGGPSSNGQVADITIEDCDVTNCSSAAIGTAYSINTTILRTSMLNSAVGVYMLGNNLVLGENNYYNGNTVDLQDISSATAPFGGTWTNTFRTIREQIFSAPVNLLSATGTLLRDNTFNSGSSLSIDANCRGTFVEPQSKFPATFTDSAPDTIWNFTTLVTTSPIGTASGGRGQRAVLTVAAGGFSAGQGFTCTTSGAAGFAVWVADPVGGGGSTPGSSASYSPSIGVSSGSFTVSASTCRTLTFGKWVLVTINYTINITSPCTLFQIGIPSGQTPVSGTTSFMGGLGGAASAAGALVATQCVLDPFAQTFDVGTITFNAGIVAYTYPTGACTIEFTGIYERT